MNFLHCTIRRSIFKLRAPLPAPINKAWASTFHIHLTANMVSVVLTSLRTRINFRTERVLSCYRSLRHGRILETRARRSAMRILNLRPRRCVFVGTWSDKRSPCIDGTAESFQGGRQQVRKFSQGACWLYRRYRGGGGGRALCARRALRLSNQGGRGSWARSRGSGRAFVCGVRAEPGPNR